MSRNLILSILTLAALVAFAPSASSQGSNPSGFERCGDPDLVLVFLNPDLQMREDGWVHASGAFFIQFQARGPKALSIEKLTFSFGKPLPAAARTCDAPEWISDVYIKNYRSDVDWEDGFFIPINTYNVGDGEYAAALSAYDKDGKELVRYFTKAKVDNGGRTNGQDPWPVQDFTQPWPMILPGDGERMDGKKGLYIEVAEAISEITAWVNGKKVDLAETQAPERDDDVIPDLGYGPLYGSGFDEGQVRKRVWGPAYEWPGDVVNEDVIKVRVVDKWGNVAEKVVHIGDPTIGGRVAGGNPEFQMQLDKTEQTTDGNGTATWNVTYKTLGDDGIHGDLYVRMADGGPVPGTLSVKMRPNHVMMGGREQLKGTVAIIATPDAEPKTYNLKLVVDYLAGESRLQKEEAMKLIVTDRAANQRALEEQEEKAAGEGQERTRGEDLQVAPTAPTTPTAPTEEVPMWIPSPGLAPLVAIVAIGALLRARRQA